MAQISNSPRLFRAPLKHGTFKRRPNTKRAPIKGDTKPPHAQEIATPNANRNREHTKPKRRPKREDSKPPRTPEGATPNANQKEYKQNHRAYKKTQHQARNEKTNTRQKTVTIKMKPVREWSLSWANCADGLRRMSETRGTLYQGASAPAHGGMYVWCVNT